MANIKGKDNYDKMPQIDGVDIIPAGGSAEQVLTKDTSTDYDYSWQDSSGGVISINTIADNSVVRGDGGANGIQQSSWIIEDDGLFHNTNVSRTGYALEVWNIQSTEGGGGLHVRGGETSGDLSMRVADADDTFTLMEIESDQGHITFGKTYAQTLIDNTSVYGLDNQHNTSAGAEDFNTQNGTYRIAGTDVIVPAGGSSGQVLEKATNANYDMQWATAGGMRPTFPIWAEENGPVTVSSNNYEFSFGNGAVSTYANPAGPIIGVNCTLIGVGCAARNNSTGTSSFSVSVTKNGTVVATSGIATGGTQNAQVKNFTAITPDTITYAPGDTVQFLTATASGTLDDVVVIAWFERTS